MGVCLLPDDKMISIRDDPIHEQGWEGKTMDATGKMYDPEADKTSVR
jgi:hypothetical protein